MCVCVCVSRAGDTVGCVVMLRSLVVVRGVDKVFRDALEHGGSPSSLLQTLRKSCVCGGFTRLLGAPKPTLCRALVMVVVSPVRIGVLR